MNGRGTTVVVDYGMGNLGSIANMFRKLGADVLVTGDSAAISTARRLVLPGVGAFDNGMRSLAERGLVPVLARRVLEEKTPILGICLGLQLFTKGSEEGKLAGLGWIDATTKRFRFEGAGALKVPHMGWNTLARLRPSRLLDALGEESRFYFVHSYYVCPSADDDVRATTRYGCEFASVVERENVLGVQFHPEKSHRFGLALLARFVEAT